LNASSGILEIASGHSAFSPNYVSLPAQKNTFWMESFHKENTQREIVLDNQLLLIHHYSEDDNGRKKNYSSWHS